jgi:hypothetical protein
VVERATRPGFLLKRASASRSSGQWQDEDYDVLADGKVIGCIYEARSGPAPSHTTFGRSGQIRGTAPRRPLRR